MRRIAAPAIFLLLLTSFWSSVRVANLTIFDLFSPVCLLLCLACPNKASVPRDPDALIVLASQVLFFFAAAFSAFAVNDVVEHVSKFLVLILATSMMFGILYVVRKREVLSFRICVLALAISATMSSALIVLQGQFFLFRNVGRNLEEDTLGVLRPTGLAEHPIEAGAVTAVGVLICAGLLFSRNAGLRGPKRSTLVKIALSIALAINLYSLKFSASLTAVFGLVVAFLIYLLVSGRHLVLVGIVVPSVLVLVPIVANPDSLLGDRLTKLLDSGSDYTTVQTRQEQLNETLGEIDARTLLIGNGYTAAAVEGREIHNALLAALFHFGLLGLVSQLLLLIYLFRKVFHKHDRNRRALHLSLVIVFLSLFLTGPVFARRSNWIAVVVTAAFLPALPRSGRSRVRAGSVETEVVG